MSARAKVLALAKELGALVDDEHPGRHFCVSVEAPAGKVWTCDTLHELVAEQSDDEKRERVWVDLLGRMQHGLATCDEPDCDWCGGAA